MLLDNYPEDTERLKRHDRLFEWVTWLLITTSYLLSFLPLRVSIDRLGVNLLFVAVALTTLIAYRVLPFERRTGLLRYTYRLKGALIWLINHLFVTLLILLTGGISSPFWFIYIVILIGGSLYLPAWVLVVQGCEAVALYLLTVGILAPWYFGSEFPGPAQMIVVPLAALFSVILTYVVARDLNRELLEHRFLSNRLKARVLEAVGEKNKLTAIVSSTSDGIFVLDKEGKFVFTNKAAQEMLGVHDEDLLNKQLGEVLSLVDVKRGRKVRDDEICPQESLAEDKVIFGPSELQLKTNKGKEVSTRFTSRVLREGGNLNIGCICVFQDVSEEKEIEQMKLDFVAMAAHELRTPLTAVRGYLSLLLEEVEKRFTKEELSWAKKAFVSTGNLAALVENLLAISRIERHSLKLGLKEHSWQEVLKEIVDNFKPQADQKNITISLKLKSKLPKITVDKFRINEVISNILANAIEHTNSGGKIEVSSWKKESEVTTSIKDNGEGIRESAIPHLFSKFFRVSGVLEQGSKGTGLGLYISKAIVEMHKGRIWVESKPGVGSTFSFSLPIENKKR